MSKLSIIKGDGGPQHRIIENEFYKIETLPKSGQIWHLWNKAGSNTDWYHEEWASNYEKEGDPCHLYVEICYVTHYHCKHSVKQKRALLESNPPRDNRCGVEIGVGLPCNSNPLLALDFLAAHA